MKKISATHQKELDAIRGKLEDARRIAEEAISKAQGIVDEALAEINGMREEAGELLREIHGKAEDFFEERSDSWKEGDAGNAYYEWMDALDEAANGFEEEFTIDLESLADEALTELEELSAKIDEVPLQPED